MGEYCGKKRAKNSPKSRKHNMGEIEFKNEQETEPRKRKTSKRKISRNTITSSRKKKSD